jgi:hypothetical protein
MLADLSDLAVHTFISHAFIHGINNNDRDAFYHPAGVRLPGDDRAG